MRRFLIVLGLALGLAQVPSLISAQPAPASSPVAKAVVAAPAAWVDVAPAPETPAPADAPAVQTLLDDNQSRLGPDGDVYFNRRVWKVLKPEGLRNFTSLGHSWEPTKETVTFHWLRILRDGKTIDLLGQGDKMLVLRRERDLERAMLDGRLTASQQLEGIQVGDVVDWAWTQTRHDPIVAGRSYDQEALSFAGAAGRYRVNISWPQGVKNRWKATPGFPQPALATVGGRTVLSVDLKDAETPKPPLGAPARFRRVGTLETSGFASWKEISALMAPLYRKAADLPAGSPLKAEAAAIAAQSRDPKVRAALALRLVEDKTRYFFIGLDDGGYVPAAADLTWTRKFGDCKGKTVLLLALLKELGVQAEPALVSLGGGDGLDERPPSLAAFNHVIVRAAIGGRAYWLDGTRTGDGGSLDGLRPPPHHWALPVRAGGADLEAIPVPPLAEPTLDAAVRVDASGGLDKPAPASMTLTFRGDVANSLRQMTASSRRADLERTFKQTYSGGSGLEIDTVDWTDNQAADSFVLRLSGKMEMDWRENPDVGRRELRVAPGQRRANFPKREPGPNSDAPFGVPYPMFARTTTELVLPDGGRGFTVRGPNGQEEFAGSAYSRTSTLEGGLARFVVEIRALRPEITAAEAEAATKASRRQTLEDSLVRAPA